MLLYHYKVSYLGGKSCFPKDAYAYQLCDFLIDCFVPIVHLPPLFCLIGMLLGTMFRLCLMTLHSINIMSTGCQANTLENCFRSVINMALVSSNRLAPTRIACSGWSRWIMCFSVRQSSFDFFGISTNFGAAMIWLKTCGRGLLPIILAEPVHVLNLTVLWMVDGMACNWKSASRRSNMFCSTGKRIIENLIVRMMLSLLSWLTSMRGRCSERNGHMFRLVKPTNGSPIGNFKSSFQEVGNC